MLVFWVYKFRHWCGQADKSCEETQGKLQVQGTVNGNLISAPETNHLVGQVDKRCEGTLGQAQVQGTVNGNLISALGTNYLIGPVD